MDYATLEYIANAINDIEPSKESELSLIADTVAQSIATYQGRSI